MITDKPLWRIYYGALLAVFCFSFAWATIKNVPIPTVPWPTLLLLIGLVGTETVIALIQRINTTPQPPVPLTALTDGSILGGQLTK